MNKQHIINELNNWIVNFLEKPNAFLGDWSPCPYARQARIYNKIDIRFSEVDELLQSIIQSLPVLEEKDVIVICFDHNQIDCISLVKFVKETNKKIMLDNYVILEDHPNDKEFVNGVLMNFNHCGLLLIQKLDKLREASDKLRSKGYYDVWGQQELDSVVNWR